jgi:glycosyltransferase involved in cell wall biosynthesis
MKQGLNTKKILMMTSSEWAGPYIRDLVYGLSNKGYEITYLSLGGPLKNKLPSSKNVTDLSLEFSTNDSMLKKVIKTYKIISRINPDLIQTHFFIAGLIGTLVGKLSRTSIILTRHHIDENYISGKRILVWLDRLSTLLANHVVVCSEAAKKWMCEIEHCNETKVTVINQGFFFDEVKYSESEIALIQSELGFSQKSFNLICICRYTPGKGHELLLESFKEVFGKINNVNLAFVGHGDSQWLKDIVQKQGLEKHVKVLNQRDDIFGCIIASDVVVHPSLVDSFSQLVIEAQFMGRAIVAFDIAAAREQILEGQTGFVVEPRDVHAMAERILLLYRNPEICLTLGTNGIEHVTKSFTHDRMINETLSLLRRVR